jgi:hypothetical protein
MCKILLIFSAIFLFTFSNKAHAEFSDEMIAPFLGPYKIEKSNIGTCPERLTMMAACTLDQLELRSSVNLDFEFLIFKGVNAGEMKTIVKNKVVEKSITTLNELNFVSKRSTYMRNYKIWFNETIELNLGTKKFSVKKAQLDMSNKNSTVTLNCDYVFDEESSKRELEEMKKTH